MYCRDPDLVERIGAATALETRASGVQYAFAPCVAVSSQKIISSKGSLAFVLSTISLGEEL